MRKICKPRFAAFIFALLFIAPYAHSRPAEGVLDGVVLNGKGAPVAFAEILWQAADGTAPHALRANANGYFRIAGVRQGLYDIRAERSGMVSDWEHNIYVRTGKVATVTLRLTRHIAPVPSGTGPSPKR
jgi:hypothetical protein